MAKSFSSFPFQNVSLDVYFENGIFTIQVIEGCENDKIFNSPFQITSKEMHQFIEHCLIMENPSILVKSK